MELKDPNLYVISLDAIDLNLLPSIYTQDGRVEPLWNSNLDRSNNEYYQFQINSSDGGKAKGPSKPELENVICHVCDIEVPKPFLIEHTQSSRHKTNLKISEIAVYRMQKHLNSTHNENSSDIDKMDTCVYFCANCVTVMDIKEKETHEKSLSHKNSVVFEKIFHEFLTLYDSNDNGNNEMEKINENGGKDCTDNVRKGSDSYTNVCKEIDYTTKEKMGNSCYINENNGFNSVENNTNGCYNTGKSEIFFYGSGSELVNNNKNNANGSYTNKRNENDGYTHKKNENNGYNSQNEGISKMKTNVNDSSSNLFLKKPLNTSKKDPIPKESIAKRVSANDYLSLLNRRKDGLMNFKLSADSDTIEIETIDGSIVKVSEENFHSFNKVGKKHIQCFVCKEIFKMSAIEAHKVSEKHIKLMVAPLRDKHCARQIDDRLSHCLICNAVIKESDYHAVCDDVHNEYLKAALVSDKLTEDYDQYAATCLTIDNSDKASPDNRKEKLENDEHVKENDDWIEVSKNKGKAEVKANTTETNIIPTKYFCASCNRYVYYSLKHNETANHIWNLKSDYHYLMKLKEDEVYCQVCKVSVTEDPDELKVIENHVHREEHVEKYNQLLVDNKIDRFKRHFYCAPCNRVILIKNELKHTSEKRHKRFFAVNCNSEVTQQLEIDKIKEQTDECRPETIDYHAEKMSLEDYVCNICNVKVPNYERNIQEHINGKSHVAKAQKEPQLTSDEGEITDINYQMELTKFPNVLNCLMCKVYILHNELSVSAHLNHTLHKMNYNTFLKDNNMVLRDNNCYCNTCKVFVGIKSEILHAFGRRHIKKQKLEMATLIELKNAKEKDIRNLKPFASNNSQNQNIATSSESINEDEQNIDAPTVSSNEVEQNIVTPCVSTNDDKQKIVTSSVSTVEDKRNIATDSVSTDDEYKRNMVTASVLINDEDEQNIVTLTASSKEDEQNIATPCVYTNDDKQNFAMPSMSTNEDKQNTATTSVPANEDKQNFATPSIDIKEDKTNIVMPSVSNTEGTQNIVTTLMCNLYADTFPPFIFDENFPMLNDLYKHGVGPNVVSLIKDHKRIRNDPDLINQTRGCGPNVVRSITKEDETNIKTPSESTNEGKQNIVTKFMCNLYADTFPPFIFDDNIPMLKYLYKHGVGPNFVSMIKDYNSRDCDLNVIKNITKEDESNIKTPSKFTNEGKQNIVTTFMSNLYADTFPPFIFDENFTMLNDLYKHGVGPNVVSMIKDYKSRDCDLNVIKNITKEDETNIKTPSESTDKGKQNIVSTFMCNLYADSFPPFIFDENFPMLKDLYKHGVGPNFVSMIKDYKRKRTDSDINVKNITKENDTDIAMPFVSANEDETVIAMTSVSTNEEKQNTATSSGSTNEEKQNISVSQNAEKQNIATPFVSVTEDETNIATTPVPMTNEDNGPSIDSCVSKVINDKHDCDPNMAKSINIPSVANVKNVNVLGKRPSLPETMLALLEPIANSTEVICKICKVKLTYSNINISSHINGSKHQNEHKKSLKSQIKNSDTSPVVIGSNASDNRPCIDTNSSKIMKDTNLTKNISNPSLTPKSVSLVLGENPGLPVTMLELLEPTANSKEVICKICKVTVPYTKSNVSGHINGSKHKNEHQKSLKSDLKYSNTALVGDHRPSIDLNTAKVVNDRDPNVAKNINIPSVSTVNASSLASICDALVLGKNPGFPETMLELLEPTANSKEVICKICKVTVPYTKSNVSGHINGSKHKNEHQKSLKSNLKYSNTALVGDHRPSIDLNTAKVVNDRDPNVAKNINIPSVSTMNASSLAPICDALVLGKNPGLPVTMLELLEPTANSKEVICKICKVTVPYTKSNVSAHINGSKHKNEHQKSLKSDLKYSKTSLVGDHRPSIDLNKPKVPNARDPNVAKNINIPSVSTVNASSLAPISDGLVLGKNPGLPVTMLELLEPTANSKVVICKVCKVKVPYSKSNVSAHINGSNHKNEYLKRLKSDIKYPSTSSVVIGSNASKVTKNTPSVSNVTKVNRGSTI